MSAFSMPFKRQRLAREIFKELQRARDVKDEGTFLSIVRARNNRTKNGK